MCIRDSPKPTSHSDSDVNEEYGGFVAHDGLALEELEPELAAVLLVDVAVGV